MGNIYNVQTYTFWQRDGAEIGYVGLLEAIAYMYALDIKVQRCLPITRCAYITLLDFPLAAISHNKIQSSINAENKIRM